MTALPNATLAPVSVMAASSRAAAAGRESPDMVPSCLCQNRLARTAWRESESWRRVSFGPAERPVARYRLNSTILARGREMPELSRVALDYALPVAGGLLYALIWYQTRG